MVTGTRPLVVTAAAGLLQVFQALQLLMEILGSAYLRWLALKVAASGSPDHAQVGEATISFLG